MPRRVSTAARSRLRRAAAALVVVQLVVGLGLAGYLQRRGAVALETPGLALTADGSVVSLSAADGLVAGTRVLDRPGTESQVSAQRSWLAAGRVPPTPPAVPPDLVAGALADLHLLTRPYGVAVAGWSPSWRYVWPRDTAFVASALARTGHLAEARAALDFLAAVQAPDGTFQARYTPDGSGVPDDRGTQADGTGWALWALAQVAGQVPAGPDRRTLVADYRGLLDASAAAAAGWAGEGPPATADYWEVPERQGTLATSAVLLAGLRGAAPLYAELGEDERAELARSAADRLEQATLSRFGPRGFPRRPGGGPASVDLGVSFLLPPFAGVESAAASRAWRRAPQHMGRPAGGLAPGGSWPRDGISWTPTVATYAMAASCVDPAAARHWLRWLAAHRTSAGSLPEKVRADGAPASVAPLAWTAAAVVITADLLDRGCPPA